MSWRHIPLACPLAVPGRDMAVAGLWVRAGEGVAPGSPKGPDELIDGDPCPACGAELDYDEVGDEREPEIVHPEPRCGWVPDGYPSTRRGWAHGRDPDAG